MNEFYNKHYVRINERGEIVDGFSDAFRQPTESDICINEQGGYQFRLTPDGEENPMLFDGESMIPLYKYVNGEVHPRTEQELAADRQAQARAAESAKWTALRLYEAGDYLTVENTLYRVTLPIPAGGRVAPGTNAVATTVVDELKTTNEHY